MSNIWQQLNHNSILKTIEETLQVKLSNLLLQRNSYINRVYELEEYDSEKRLIVKFYRPERWSNEMIEEEHEFLKELAAQEISVIPPLTFNNKTLFTLENIPFAIFPKKGGRALDEFDQEGWETIGRILARIHLVGAEHKASQRITWRPGIATNHHLETLLKSNFIPTSFQKTFKDTADSFIKKADPLFNNQELILIHGDCHKGNLIHRPNEGIVIVDFDDICVGPPVQDIWMLFPDEISNCEKELEWFLKGYKIFRPFDLKALKLIPALRGMRIIHFASWLAVQSHDPDFESNFPETGTSRYWNELIKDLQGITMQI
ncbi:hypothetical protein A2291_02785 [candidate division WOR-1 bacterium RIFOXYB2_FULL_42_35]|uniref:Aminoglycoside phosphotransferase domain-containing protein n=1 Tax=candidate division WOR-1 bacterium RIFOXYC2_FULL_41_25 TaxID=1802586 RepID=A0A1F4TMP5_UNCSA|nr:MAG: hypothetical protein A2247_04915 [candidate division WOR-1 bacterium RIFOXYA2_FULL_41_14]OGC23119.1 MAG: hypothetical protein A2291_02785 [candidate division WOR-1 bacterium RIFOXYB2_FULL_42_35]OGC33966.1 MAG: hypothetical protein A2462_07620 [candidate division WOR-1 bacterium RIFOXYC2_FULL_41_25]